MTAYTVSVEALVTVEVDVKASCMDDAEQRALRIAEANVRPTASWVRFIDIDAKTLHIQLDKNA